MTTSQSTATADPAQELAAFINQLSYSDLPEEAPEIVEKSFIDTVGVAIAGTGSEETKIPITAFSSERSQTGAATVFGTPHRAPPAEAALINGTAAHALDYDDSALATDGHFSSSTVPAIFAAADWAGGVSGEDLITAYVAAFESEAYISSNARRSEANGDFNYDDGLHVRGWHPTAIYNTFGATAAAAKIVDLTEPQINNALNIVTSFPSGLKANFGSMTKPLHSGLAAQSGVMAVLLAAEGFTGNDGAFIDEKGFFDVYTGRNSIHAYDPPTVDGPWNITNENINIMRKKYPSCGATHAVIETALELTSEHGIEPDDVAEIDASVPIHKQEILHTNIPQSESEARFSLPYVAAVAVISDKVGIREFERSYLSNPELQEMCKRVNSIFDPDNQAGYRSKVSIRTKSNETYSRAKDRPILSTADLYTKFTDCAAIKFSAAESDDIYEQLSNLSTVSDSAGITDDLVTAQ